MLPSMSQAERLARVVLLYHRGPRGRWTDFEHELWDTYTGGKPVGEEGLCELAREVRDAEKGGVAFSVSGSSGRTGPAGPQSTENGEDHGDAEQAKSEGLRAEGAT